MLFLVTRFGIGWSSSFRVDISPFVLFSWIQHIEWWAGEFSMIFFQESISTVVFLGKGVYCSKTKLSDRITFLWYAISRKRCCVDLYKLYYKNCKNCKISSTSSFCWLYTPKLGAVKNSFFFFFKRLYKMPVSKIVTNPYFSFVTPEKLIKV